MRLRRRSLFAALVTHLLKIPTCLIVPLIMTGMSVDCDDLLAYKNLELAKYHADNHSRQISMMKGTGMFAAMNFPNANAKYQVLNMGPFFQRLSTVLVILRFSFVLAHQNRQICSMSKDQQNELCAKYLMLHVMLDQKYDAHEEHHSTSVVLSSTLVALHSAPKGSASLSHELQTHLEAHPSVQFSWARLSTCQSSQRRLFLS